MRLQVPGIRSQMVNGRDWKHLAESLKRGTLKPGAARAAAQDRMMSMLDAFNFMAESSLTMGMGHERSAPAEPTHMPVKVTLYRKTSKGTFEPWSDLQLDIDGSVATSNVSFKVQLACSFSCACSFHVLAFKHDPY